MAGDPSLAGALLQIVEGVAGAAVVGVLGWTLRRVISQGEHIRDLMARLKALETWKREHSIDRSEFADLKARVAEGESEMGKVSETTSELVTSTKVLSTQLEGFEKLTQRDIAEVARGVTELRSMFDRLLVSLERRIA